MKFRSILIWMTLATIIVVPIFAAALSPLLAWRDPIYISAGFAGIISMVLLLIQPLLAAGLLPDLSRQRARKLHHWVGATLIAAVLFHVIGLWVTSPPDVIDVLLFRSPTPFSVWGALAMWAIFGAALMALFKQRLPIRYRHWRIGHTTLVTATVIGSVIHAILIEGTMETLSKIVLCLMVIAATAGAVFALRAWTSQYRHNQD